MNNIDRATSAVFSGMGFIGMMALMFWGIFINDISGTAIMAFFAGIFLATTVYLIAGVKD